MTDLVPDELMLNIEVEEDQPNWRMYFDGTVNVPRSGIVAILISPIGAHYPVQSN